MKRPPKHFDLSTSAAVGTAYVPPKARDPQEIDRRRSLAPGELVLEQQQRGIIIARTILPKLTERPSLVFGGELIAVSALNSSWHTFAQPERSQEEVRRKQLQYPWLKDWQDANGLLMGVERSLDTAMPLAGLLVRAHSVDTPRLHERRRDLGRCLGNAALALVCAINLGDDPIPGTVLRAQQFAREQGVRLQEKRAEWAERIGTAPTLAQLSDSDSDLSVYWRRNAPSQAFNAYAQALAD